MTDSHVHTQYQEAIHELFTKGLYIPAISLMDTFNIQLKDPSDTLFNTFVWLQIGVSHKDDFKERYDFRPHEVVRIDFLKSSL